MVRSAVANWLSYYTHHKPLKQDIIRVLSLVEAWLVADAVQRSSQGTQFQAPVRHAAAHDLWGKPLKRAIPAGGDA
jgi:hypothetical protein